MRALAHGDIHLPSVGEDRRSSPVSASHHLLQLLRCDECTSSDEAAMSKTMRLLAALPTAKSAWTYEMEIRPFGEKWWDCYLFNDNKRN
jgi:hypothetical protein